MIAWSLVLFRYFPLKKIEDRLLFLLLLSFLSLLAFLLNLLFLLFLMGMMMRLSI